MIAHIEILTFRHMNATPLDEFIYPPDLSNLLFYLKFNHRVRSLY